MPELPETLDLFCRTYGVDPRLLLTRMQLEQSALTYAWDGTSRDYPGGDADKLKYLCGADRTDSGDRPQGWFGWALQLLAVIGRFKFWYRGRDGGDNLPNWLGLSEDPRFRPGQPCQVRGGTVTPANQASADCLRYTPHRDAAIALRGVGLRYFAEDYRA